MRLYICGSRGSYPTAGAEYQQFGCSTSCYALVSGSYGIVVDCGTGAVHLPEILKQCDHIDVLFTHYHLDHLMGIVSCLGRIGSHTRLRMIETGARGAMESAIGNLLRPPYWPVTVHPKNCSYLQVISGQEVLLDREEGITLRTFPANHPDGGSLLRFSSKDTALCLLCDHEQCEENSALISFAAGSRWILFDGMYTQEEYPTHRGWGHSTWNEGIQTAKAAGVEHLLITHHAPWRTDKQLLELERLAQQKYPGCVFAREGAEYEL